MNKYWKTIKAEAKRGYAGEDFHSRRHPAYVSKDPDTIALAKRFNKTPYDVATDIIAVRLSNDRAKVAI